jgi:hypothetical protein
VRIAGVVGRRPRGGKVSGQIQRHEAQRQLRYTLTPPADGANVAPDSRDRVPHPSTARRSDQPIVALSYRQPHARDRRSGRPAMAYSAVAHPNRVCIRGSVRSLPSRFASTPRRVAESSSQRGRKRSGSSYFPSFLEPRRRCEQAIVSVVLEAYVNGVSTRKVDRLVESNARQSAETRSLVIPSRVERRRPATILDVLGVQPQVRRVGALQRTRANQLDLRSARETVLDISSHVSHWWRRAWRSSGAAGRRSADPQIRRSACHCARRHAMRTYEGTNKRRGFGGEGAGR